MRLKNLSELLRRFSEEFSIECLEIQEALPLEHTSEPLELLECS